MEIRQVRKAGVRTSDTLVLDKGTYYIGDVCYALGDDVYYKGWGDRFGFANGLYEVDGKQFAVLSTAYGDGQYEAKGFPYDLPVDAGNIGMVNVGLVDKFGAGDKVSFGVVMTFDSDIEFSYDAGLISVVSGDFEMQIDTAYDDDWDDDDWDDDDDDDDDDDEDDEEDLSED